MDSGAAMTRVGLIVLTLILITLISMLGSCAPVTDSPATPPIAAFSSPSRVISNDLTAAPYDAGRTEAEPSIRTGFDCTAVIEIPAAECEGLVALYQSTNGKDWIDNEGWLTSKTPCLWTGITCMANHVSHLNLSLNQLSGSLPPELGNLSHLEGIDLGSNQLLGLVPAEIGKLTELTSLHLWDNQLTSPLPLELVDLEILHSLSLARNQMKGLIPPALGDMKSLESLDLSYNQFTGEIPANLGGLINLYALNLSHNFLSGSIPYSLGSLDKLDELDLSYNELRGAVPETLSQVIGSRLWGNQLDGTINTVGTTPFAVDFEGVHFSADSALATTIWPEIRQATPLPEVLDGPSYWMAIPRHVRFTFADPRLPAERRRMGFNLVAEAQILVFSTAELENMNPMAQMQLETLQTLLASGGTVPAGELPLLPLTNSAQVFQAQVQFMDSGSIHGLQFISQHSQDPHPIILSQEIFYTFQGFTKDGSYYVAAFFPLTAAALPETIDIEDWDAFHANYDTYLSEKTAILDHLQPSEFKPNLTILDELISSLYVDPSTLAAGNRAHG